MKSLVIYHINCIDGSAAAVAHCISLENSLKSTHVKAEALRTTSYVPMGYATLENKEEFFKIVEGFDHITFLDFCPTQPLLQQLLNEGREIKILDHHKTAYEMIEKHFSDYTDNNLQVIFSKDNKLSGATLAWVIGMSGYLIPLNTKLRDVVVHGHQFLTNVGIGFIKESTLKYKDPLYNLIGIRDLWDESNPKEKLHADHLHAYLNFHDIRNFEKLLTFVKSEAFATREFDILEEGATIIAVNQKVCQDALDEAHKSVISTKEGDIHLAIGICPTGQGSLFGELWRKANPGKKTIAVGLFFGFNRQSIIAGLRSSGIDALRLAQSFPGGGGHDNACGCNLTNAAIPYEHISNNATDSLDWLIYEFGERIATIYNKPALEKSAT